MKKNGKNGMKYKFNQIQTKSYKTEEDYIEWKRGKWSDIELNKFNSNKTNWNGRKQNEQECKKDN